MAGAKAAIMDSLRQQPLGAADGEGSLQAPFNAPKEYVRVRVRNLSAIKQRRYIEEAVSWLRGGEDTIDERAKKGELSAAISLDTLHRQAAAGREASFTQDGVKPINIVLTFDNGHYLIPHTGEDGTEAPWTEVPDGVYDLYVGNYNRLRDPREAAKEIERVKSRRKDFIVRPNEKNPWAFLEFDYEVIKPTAVAVDAERIYSGEVVEV